MIVAVAVMVTDEVTVDVTVEATVLLLGVEHPARKIAVAAAATATFPPCITAFSLLSLIGGELPQRRLDHKPSPM